MFAAAIAASNAVGDDDPIVELKLERPTIKNRQAVVGAIAQRAGEEDAAALRAAADQLEIQARLLAQRLRKGGGQENPKGDPNVVANDPLRDAVAKAHDARMRSYEAQLARLNERVRKLEAALRQQNATRADAIQRRIKELLNNDQEDPLQRYDLPVAPPVAPPPTMPQPAANPLVPLSGPVDGSSLPPTTNRVEGVSTPISLLRSTEDFHRTALEQRGKLLRAERQLKQAATWAPAALFGKEISTSEYTKAAGDFQRAYREYQAQMRLFEIASREAAESASLRANRLTTVEKLRAAGTIPESEVASARDALQRAKNDLERIETMRSLYAPIIESFGPNPEKMSATWTRPQSPSDGRDELWGQLKVGVRELRPNELREYIQQSHPGLSSDLAGGLVVELKGSTGGRLDRSLEGTIILSVDDAPTPTRRALLSALGRAPSEKGATLTLLAGNRLRKVTVRNGKFEDATSTVPSRTTDSLRKPASQPAARTEATNAKRP